MDKNTFTESLQSRISGTSWYHRWTFPRCLCRHVIISWGQKPGPKK